MSRLTAWWRARRSARDDERRDRGFGWVMTAYYLHKWPVSYILDVAYNGSLRDGRDTFYDGVGEALRLLPAQDADDPNWCAS